MDRFRQSRKTADTGDTPGHPGSPSHLNHPGRQCVDDRTWPDHEGPDRAHQLWAADGEHVSRPAHAAGSAIANIDMPRIAAAVREILLARAYAELFSGLHRSPAVHLNRVFHQRSDEAVIVRGIAFHSLCEHHLLPMFGTVHIAYLPTDGQVVGLSKLARTVEVFALRPQMQERLTEQIADALEDLLGARGVAVIVEGEHFCMKMRGVRQTSSHMITSAFRGDLAEDTNLKAVTVGLLRPACTHNGDHPDAQ